MGSRGCCHSLVAPITDFALSKRSSMLPRIAQPFMALCQVLLFWDVLDGQTEDRLDSRCGILELGVLGVDIVRCIAHTMSGKLSY